MRGVWSELDGDDAPMSDAHHAPEADEPGVLTISRKTAKALAAAAAAEHAASHGHADSADDASFEADYRALYRQQLLPKAHGEGGASGGSGRTVFSFEVDAAHVDTLKEAFMNSLDPPLPMMAEYDFRRDSDALPRLDMALRNPGELRPYQERCLR